MSTEPKWGPGLGTLSWYILMPSTSVIIRKTSLSTRRMLHQHCQSFGQKKTVKIHEPYIHNILKNAQVLLVISKYMTETKHTQALFSNKPSSQCLYSQTIEFVSTVTSQLSLLDCLPTLPPTVQNEPGFIQTEAFN